MVAAEVQAVKVAAVVQAQRVEAMEDLEALDLVARLARLDLARLDLVRLDRARQVLRDLALQPDQSIPTLQPALTQCSSFLLLSHLCWSCSFKITIISTSLNCFKSSALLTSQGLCKENSVILNNLKIFDSNSSFSYCELFHRVERRLAWIFGEAYRLAHVSSGSLCIPTLSNMRPQLTGSTISGLVWQGKVHKANSLYSIKAKAEPSSFRADLFLDIVGALRSPMLS
jgi:hypothetical protein